MTKGIGETTKQTDIELIMSEKAEVVRAARHLLDLFVQNKLLPDNPYERLTRDQLLVAETKSREHGIENLLLEASKHLARIGEFEFNELSRHRIARLQYMLKSATNWWHFDSPIGVLRNFEVIADIEIDCSRRPFDLTWNYVWHQEDDEGRSKRLTI